MTDKEYEYDDRKSRSLRKERGLGFEEIITLIESGNLLATEPHTNQADYPDQRVYLIDVEGYIWRVPHIQRGEIIRLITCYPSRKATKQWRKEKTYGTAKNKTDQ